MTELERALLELGARLEFPPTPDLAGAVRTRLAEPRGWRRLLERRAVAIALAVLALGVATAFAVPPARTAILRWLGIEGARIRLVEKLPATPLERELRLGERVTLAEAMERVGFRIRVPRGDGFNDPDAVYVSEAVPRGVVSFLYGSPKRVRALLTQFVSEPGFPYIDKSAGPETSVESVRVDGGRGYWLEGRPHLFVFRNAYGQSQAGSLRLAGNTLVWQVGRLTLRLEGKLTKEQALRVAESLR
jgi:hypothetical protein